jgi:hypothetical protein
MDAQMTAPETSPASAKPAASPAGTVKAAPMVRQTRKSTVSDKVFMWELRSAGPDGQWAVCDALPGMEPTAPMFCDERLSDDIVLRGP